MEQSGLVSVDSSMIIQMINFLVMVYVFYKLFSKKIGGVIEERKKIAIKELEEARIQQEKNENEKVLIEKLSEESKKRANEIVIKAEKLADERKEQIIGDANITKDRMMENARKEIVRMKSQAEIELQKEIGKLAVEVAEKLLKENINTNETLKTNSIDNFIAEIGE